MLDVRKLLAQRPLLFDGGMGTYYKAKPGQECEQANLTDPEGILAVHRAYLAAGADAIKTNTFSLPRLAAAQQPGWEQLADAGWQLAVKAAGETGAAVFADLGPAPDTENLPAEQVYLAVAKRFALLGARNFLFETLSAEDGVLEAIRALKQTVPEAFVLVSFAVLPDGYTREGRYCAELVRRVAQSGVVDAVGLNCVSAPGAMRALVQQLGDAGLPLSVMPNAGYPVVARAQVRYQGKPEYFARELSRLASEGVRILGGCCGTTPQHIAALRTALDALPEVLPAAPAAKPAVVHPAPGTQLPFEGGHNFRELGGYEADEGKHIKWGQIYRGIPTWKLTSEADRKLLDSLGLRLILDLRSEAEAAETPDYVPDGARLVRICGLCLENGKEVDFSPEDRENLLKGMPDEGRRMADAMYERMLFGNKAYKELFRALEAGETPVLFHCSAGKDRTGVAAMLILLALGASDKTIAEDFEKTNIWRRPELEAVWAEHAEEIAADPARKDFYLGVFGVHPESAPFVLSIIRERYGSADAYLEAEYGLTPARLMRLRRMYLE